MEVTLGVVGLGYWGPNLLRVLVDAPDTKVRWACDLDSSRLERFGRRYPSVRLTQRIDDVLEDPAVDAVLIATPVLTHFELARRALDAGKHVFVEKPLASSAREADDLVELAQRSGLTLMCGQTFLYSPPVLAVREMLQRGDLGDVFFISASRVNLGPYRSDVSVLWDLGPHDFSMVLYWLGEMPVSVRAIGRDVIMRDVSDVAFVTMTFPSGVLANIELSWLAPSKLRRTVVVGSRKMVVYDDTSAEAIRVFDHGPVYQDPETFGQYHLSYRTGEITSPRLDVVEPLVRELEHFVATIRGEASAVEHTELACNVVRLIEAADASLGTAGAEAPVAPAIVERTL